MRGGELSNELASGVAMRFERVIKTDEGKLNRSAKAYLQSINRLDVNLYIISTGDRRKALSFIVKWGIPYFQVISADSTLEIPDIIRENDIVAYYDADQRVLQNVISRRLRPIEAKLWTAYEVY